MGVQIFLYDPCDLSVHEVATGKIRVAPGGTVSHSVEQEARTGILAGMCMAERFPLSNVEGETLMFVKLEKDHGWVWASTCRVRNSQDQRERGFPITATTLGDDFLFLWPVPVAIHVYVNIKDKRRRQVANHNSAFHTQVLDHPPCFSYLPNKRGLPGYLRLPTVRKVSAKELTIAQRLFVASLKPNASPFARRKPNDKWVMKLDNQDRAQFEAWRAAQQSRLPAPLRVDLDEATGRAARGRPKRVRRDHGGACHLLSLPDDLLERVLSFCISECLHNFAEVKSTVSGLITVATQFRRATWSVVDHMLERIARAAASLLTDNPREPSEVQAVTQAACLSLQHALRVVPGDWPYYLRLREQPGPGSKMDSRRHVHDLLWCHE